jgi:hypothetical protein
MQKNKTSGPAKTAAKKKKKVKFKKIEFKITAQQKEALEKICKRQHTTPVKFLKTQVRKQVSRYLANTEAPSYVTENQLQLFDVNNPPQ